MKELAGTRLKTVLITGASRGIGRALCAEAVKRGYRVHGLVRNPHDAPVGVTSHFADIRNRELMDGLLHKLAPEVDVFIANAGIDAPHNPRDPASAERAADVFDVNGSATAFSVFRLAHLWVTGGWRDRRIAVVSSLAAGRGLPRSGAYIATKIAQLALCQSLERDLASHGIGVSVIQPGFVATDMSNKQPFRPGLMSAERAAQIIWDGLDRGRFRIAFPWSMRAVTWFVNSLPYSVFRRLVMLLQKRKMM